jgi:hypothetical protein
MCAWWHDVGRLFGERNHERKSAQMLVAYLAKERVYDIPQDNFLEVSSER